MIVTVIQFISRLLFIIAIWYQWKYNRLHHSIYGLSYDMYTITFTSSLISIWCSLNYTFSPLVRSQLTNRFPLFYPIDEISKIPISYILLLSDSIIVVGCINIFRQLIKYRSSKHIHQGSSKLCVTLIVIFTTFSVFTYICASHNLPIDSGKFGIFYLEHINYLWVLGNFLCAFKMTPQVSLNWMGQSTSGLSSRFVVFSFFSFVIELLGTMLLYNERDYFQIPFNHQPIFVTLIQLILVCIIFYQAQYLYWGVKPYLPKGKSFVV